MSMNSVSPTKRYELLAQDIRVVTPHKSEGNYATISSTEEDNNDAEEPETIEEIISLSASTTAPNFCGFEHIENNSPANDNNITCVQQQRKGSAQFFPDNSGGGQNDDNAKLEYSGSDSDNSESMCCRGRATDKIENVQKIEQNENFKLNKRFWHRQINSRKAVVASTSTETLTPSSSSIPIPAQMPMPIEMPETQISGPLLDHIVEINSDSTTQTQRQKRQQIVNKYQVNLKQQEQELTCQLPAHPNQRQEHNKARKSATHATITTATATMHKNEYSSESSTEFPISSASNPQQPSPVDGVQAGAKSVCEKYKNSTQLLRNTLPADSIDRQLIMINKYNPQMSLTERIQLWHCEQSVSDVEDVKTFDDEYKRFEEHKKQLMQHFVNYKHLNIENELHQMEYQTEYRHSQKGLGFSKTNDMRRSVGGNNVAQTPGSLDSKLYVMTKQRGRNCYNSSESEECRGKLQMAKDKPSTSTLALQRRRLRIQSALARSGLERLDGTSRYKSRLCKNIQKKRLESTTPPSSLSSSDVELSHTLNNNHNYKSSDNGQNLKMPWSHVQQQQEQQRVEVYDKILCRSSSDEEQKKETTTVPLAMELLENEVQKSQISTNFNDNRRADSRTGTKQFMPTSLVDAKTRQQHKRLNESMDCEVVTMQEKKKYQIVIQQHLDFTDKNQNHYQDDNDDGGCHGNDTKKINEVELFKSPVVPQKYTTANVEGIQPTSASASVTTAVSISPTNSVVCLTANEKQKLQTDSLKEKYECELITKNFTKTTEAATTEKKIEDVEATMKEDKMFKTIKKPEENDENEYKACDNNVAVSKDGISGHGDNGVYHQQYEFCSYLGLTGMSTAAAMANAVAELAQCNMARRSMRVLRQQHKERQENYNKSRRDLEDLKIKQLKEIKRREKGGQELMCNSQSQTEPSERSQRSERSLPFSIKPSDIKSSTMTLINGKSLKDTSVTLLKREPEIKILCHINASSKEEIEMKSKECIKEIVQPIKDTIKRQLEEQQRLQQEAIGDVNEIKAGFNNDSKRHSLSDAIQGFVEMPTTSKKALEALTLKSSASFHRLLKPTVNSFSILENCLMNETNGYKMETEQKEQDRSQWQTQAQSQSQLQPINEPSKSVPSKAETVGDTLDNVNKVTPHVRPILRKISSEREAENKSTTSDTSRLDLFRNVQNALMESRKVKPKVFIIQSIDSNANRAKERHQKMVRIVTTFPSQDEQGSTKQIRYNDHDEHRQQIDRNYEGTDDDDGMVSEVAHSPTPPIYSPINTPTNKIEIRKQQLKSPFTTNNSHNNIGINSSGRVNNSNKNSHTKRSTAKFLKKTLYVNTCSHKALNKVRLMSFKRPRRRQLRKHTKLIILKTIKSATRKMQSTTNDGQPKGEAKKSEKERGKKKKTLKSLTTKTTTSSKMNDKLLSSPSSVYSEPCSTSANRKHHHTKNKAKSSGPAMTNKRSCVSYRHVETEMKDFDEYLKQLQQHKHEQLKEEQEQNQPQGHLRELRRRRFTLIEAATTAPPSLSPIRSKVAGDVLVKSPKLDLKRTRTQILHTGGYDLSQPKIDLLKGKKKLTHQQSEIEIVDGVKGDKDEQNNGHECENNVVVSSTTNSFDQIAPAMGITNNIVEPCNLLTPPINSLQTTPIVHGSVSYVIMGAPSPVQTKDQATQSSINNIRYLNISSSQQLQDQQQEQCGSMNERRHHQKRLNGMRNPLKDDFGKVLHIYYELDVLIVIQELLVTFWKSSKLLNILTTRSSSSSSIPMKSTPHNNHHHYNHNYYNHQHFHQNENNLWMNDMDELAPSSTLESSYMGEWLLLGELRYLTYDHEISAVYANRICVHNSIPIYVEMRGRPMPQHQRECHLLCMYVNIYYYNDEERLAKFSSIHLDSIQSDITLVNYTTITDSRYFIMTWPKENILNKSRSGICKYSLTPQLDTLASIRSFNSMCHVIHYMECMKDDKLIGFGDSQVTVWDHRSGDVLMNYDLVIPLGKNLASIYYHSQDLAQLQNGSTGNVLILYQFRHFSNSTPPELLILACNISHTTPSYSILHQYTLPIDEVPGLNSATTTGDHIILNTANDQEIWISCTNPNLMICVPITTSSDGITDYGRRFYGRHQHHVIELNQKTLNVDNLANLLLKLAAGTLTYT